MARIVKQKKDVARSNKTSYKPRISKERGVAVPKRRPRKLAPLTNPKLKRKRSSSQDATTNKKPRQSKALSNAKQWAAMQGIPIDDGDTGEGYSSDEAVVALKNTSSLSRAKQWAAENGINVDDTDTSEESSSDEDSSSYEEEEDEQVDFVPPPVLPTDSPQLHMKTARTVIRPVRRSTSNDRCRPVDTRFVRQEPPIASFRAPSVPVPRPVTSPVISPTRRHVDPPAPPAPYEEEPVYNEEEIVEDTWQQPQEDGARRQGKALWLFVFWAAFCMATVVAILSPASASVAPGQAPPETMASRRRLPYESRTMVEAVAHWVVQHTKECLDLVTCENPLFLQWLSMDSSLFDLEQILVELNFFNVRDAFEASHDFKSILSASAYRDILTTVLTEDGSIAIGVSPELSLRETWIAFSLRLLHWLCRQCLGITQQVLSFVAAWMAGFNENAPATLFFTAVMIFALMIRRRLLVMLVGAGVTKPGSRKFDENFRRQPSSHGRGEELSARDKLVCQALDKIAAEIEHLGTQRDLLPEIVLSELITKICIQLDSIETNGSQLLRSKRKELLRMAQQMDSH